MEVPAGMGTKQPPERVRAAIRELLVNRPEYLALDSSTRLALARGLVKICAAALDLASETEAANGAVPSPRPLARAQSAGSEFSGVSAQRVAETTRQILNAVSFPRFVTELINGVFKALVDTNQQQMQSYVELIRNVAASTEGFADANVGVGGARQWLVERFPGSFTVEGEIDEFAEPGQQLTPEEKAERDAETRLRLRPGATMPSEAAFRLAFGLGPQDSVPGGDPENLVPLARIALARNRQQMLSTMVMLGMQRIVIESGRLNASMRFHIDTRSAAQQDLGSQFDLRNTATVAGSFGYGPWGASASMTNTIGYVSTQKTQTTEEMNTDLDLNSSVELIFKTDYLPLDRLAGKEQVDRIKVHTLNPEAEAKAATEARQAREKRIGESDVKRRDSLDKAISPPPAAPSPPKPGAPGSVEAAQKAREDAEKKKKAEPTTPAKTGGTQPAPTGGAQPGSARTTPGDTSTPRPTSGTGNPPAPTGTSPPAATGTAPPAPGGKTPPPGGSRTESAGTGTAGKPATPTKSQAFSLLGQNSSSENHALPAHAGRRLDPKGSETSNFPVADRRPDVVYIPTPQEMIDEMLGLAALKKGELLYDLGCGDGRIVVTAAKKYGCRAVGFDIDPRRVAESVANVRTNGLTNLARIEQRDIFTVDLREADVVTVYLLPELNVRLISQFETMKRGARIVSHDFDMNGVIPDRVVQIYLPSLHMYKTLYLWETPLRHLSRPVRHEWANSVGLTAA